MQSSAGWVPVFADGSRRLAVMSIGFLLADDRQAVVWRGPKKTAMIKQFISDVVWGDGDYMVIDTPPGTSDEHITIAQALSGQGLDGAILVTTPQAVACDDVRKEATFCRKLGVKIIGLVENMSGYVCPCCNEVSHVFGKGGGEALAAELNVPFLGSIPIDPRVGK